MTDNDKKDDLALRFDIHDIESMVSHWALQNFQTVEKIAETEEWKRDRTFTARVTVNGVEISFKALDDFLMEQYNRELKKLEAHFADAREAAEARAREILKERAAGALEAIEKIESSLREAEHVIRPYWEKE